MKLIYSHLQKLLADHNVDPQKVRDDLTMMRHFCKSCAEIEQAVGFDLDLKVNRGGLLGYYDRA